MVGSRNVRSCGLGCDIFGALFLVGASLRESMGNFFNRTCVEHGLRYCLYEMKRSSRQDLVVKIVLTRIYAIVPTMIEMVV
jgi:hypothetical protein